MEGSRSINEKDKNGKTALIRAVDCNDLKEVKSLIENGADVNIVAHDGRTALSYAIENRSLPMVKLLVKNKANVNHIDILGWSPLDDSEYGDGNRVIYDYLVSKGAKSGAGTQGAKWCGVAKSDTSSVGGTSRGAEGVQPSYLLDMSEVMNTDFHVLMERFVARHGQK